MSMVRQGVKMTADYSREEKVLISAVQGEAVA
jgi:hypothetical protein